MRPLILCLERLERILSILARCGRQLPIRDFQRTYSVHAWEVEQAAELGWIRIETRKPRTGRPSQIAIELSQTPAAKLPPRRKELGKLINFRHWDFAAALVLCARKRRRGSALGRSLGMGGWASFTDVYMTAFPRARSRAGAAVSAGRLLKHPHVKIARAWYRAKADFIIPHDALAPETDVEVCRAVIAVRRKQ